jgi:hypothetical protein
MLIPYSEMPLASLKTDHHWRTPVRRIASRETLP